VLASLVVCAMLTTGQNRGGNVANYVRDVLLVTVVLDLIVAVLSFVSSYHYAIYIFNGRLCLLSVGQYYVELLMVEGKVKGKDYVVRSRSYLHGFIRFDSIRDYAPEKDDSRALYTLRKEASFMQTNPMHLPQTAIDTEKRKATARTSAVPDSIVFTRDSLRSSSMERSPRPSAEPSTATTIFNLFKRNSKSSSATANSAGVSEFEMSDVAFHDEADHSHTEDDNADGFVVPTKNIPPGLQGRRRSFVQNLLFFEQKFGGNKVSDKSKFLPLVNQKRVNLSSLSSTVFSNLSGNNSEDSARRELNRSKTKKGGVDVNDDDDNIHDVHL